MSVEAMLMSLMSLGCGCCVLADFGNAFAEVGDGFDEFGRGFGTGAWR